jgi:1-acyl-sn-glycerol-3-phosphate acyltransferase
VPLPVVRPAPFLYRLVVLVLRPLVRLVFRLALSGGDNVPPGGIVLSANHLSGFDSVALAVPLYPRWLRNMGKNELFDNPVLAFALTRLGVFPAHGDAEGSSVRAAAQIARGGDVVVIMPEGARRRNGRVHEPHTGAARTALEAGVPLVPAAIKGTDRTRKLAHWHIAFGPPVPLDDLQTVDRDEAARVATDRLWNAITALEKDLA